VPEIEARLREITRNWGDDLRGALLDHCGEERGLSLYRRYGAGLRSDYREHYVPRIAVHDIEQMETLAEGEHSLAMSLYQPLEAPDGLLQFKMFRAERPISLSDALPMLENMGLRVEEERPSEIQRADGACVWMHDFSMKYSGKDELDLDEIRDKFQETFARVWCRDVENDGFNRLVLRAKLGWREIVIIRAYCKYLRQAGWTFSHRYVQRALSINPHIAALLVQLFHARFDPERRCDSEDLLSEIHAALDAVEHLDEDRILRSLLGAILATLRTNFYQTGENGEAKPYLSFKFDPKKVLELPEPRPMFEIFVYSPRVEARTSVPRCWDWSRRRWSRTPLSYRSGRRAASCRRCCRREATGKPFRPRASRVTRLSSAASWTSRTIWSRAAWCRLPGSCVMRSLSGGRRRQGYSHLFRHRQRHF
jgi:glutamate dehydrogenase